MDSRLVDIETRIAFNEDAINQLNDVILMQQKRIEQLEELCKRLREQLQQAMPASDGGKPADEKPPHY